MATRTLRLFIVIIIVLIFVHAEAYDAFAPWDYVKPSGGETASPFAKRDISVPASLMKTGVMFFSKYVSPVDGDRCFMYPTCAAYSREAFEKHGFWGGILLTADRLMHEGDEKNRAPLIKVGNRLRYLDTLNNNDYWWQ
jgi:hypothetical protein